MEKTKTIELYETFNADKLFYIINNSQSLKSQFRPSCFNDPKYNPFKIAKKYLDKSRHGKIKVRYKQNNSYGRFYAVGSLSMQSLTREIRHTIQNNYVDIDIKNAHPVILYHLCKVHKIKCKYLKIYIENRDKCLSNLDISREKAKITYLSITNGGQLDYNQLKKKTKHIKMFRKEMIKIHDEICKKFNEKFEKHKKDREDKKINFNHKGSYINTLLCDYENKLLMNIYKYFKCPTDCVLCFDGLMLKANKIYDLVECEKYIKQKLNIDIKLINKPFDNKLILPENLPKYNYERLEYFNDYKKLMKKKGVTSDMVYEWLNNSMALIDNCGEQFILTKNKRIHYYPDKTKEEYSEWVPIKIDKLKQTLKISCDILDPKFDENLFKEFNSIESVEEQELFYKMNKDKLNKYLFRTLGFDNKKHGEGFLSHVLENRLIRTNNNLDFLPFFKQKPELEDTFNIFSDFPLQNVEIKKNIEFEKTIFHKHLLSQFFNDDINECKHFYDFVSDIIQDPSNIKSSAHLFYSPQGCGKGLLAKFLTKLLGIKNTTTIIDTENYFSTKFNYNSAHKLLKIFEEVSDKGGAFKNHNRLKGEITSETERVEKKGIDAYSTRHCARYIFNTNNKNCLYIENDGRRITMHEVKNKYANNYNYFKPLWELVADVDFLKSAFEYFSNRKYDIKNVMKAYDTKYKFEQKITNLPNSILFLIDFIEQNYDEAVNKNFLIKKIEFNSKYREYCHENGVKYHLKTMQTQFLKLGIEKCKRKIVKFGNNSPKKYTIFYINPHKIQSLLRSYLKNENFKFNFISDNNIEHVKDDNNLNSDFFDTIDF
jgi:hypothetical protein